MSQTQELFRNSFIDICSSVPFLQPHHQPHHGCILLVLRVPRVVELTLLGFWRDCLGCSATWLAPWCSTPPTPWPTWCRRRRSGGSWSSWGSAQPTSSTGTRSVRIFWGGIQPVSRSRDIKLSRHSTVHSLQSIWRSSFIKPLLMNGPIIVKHSVD